jgi:hypothetical protein
MAVNVSAAANLSSTSHTKFIGCAFALSSYTTTGFSPQAAIASGLLDSAPGSLITEYVFSQCFLVQPNLMKPDSGSRNTIIVDLIVKGAAAFCRA